MNTSFDYPVQYPRHETALMDAHSLGGANVAKLSSGAGLGGTLFGADGLTFKDAIDVVNPLQQLPIVGDVYRGLTGDSISLVSRVAGGALIGGPFGALAAVAGSLFEAITGGGVTSHAMALLDNETTSKQAASQYSKVYKLG